MLSETTPSSKSSSLKTKPQVWSWGTFKSTFQLEPYLHLIRLNVENEGCIVGSVEIERKKGNRDMAFPSKTFI